MDLGINNLGKGIAVFDIAEDFRFVCIDFKHDKLFYVSKIRQLLEKKVLLGKYNKRFENYAENNQCQNFARYAPILKIETFSKRSDFFYFSIHRFSFFSNSISL